MKKYRSSLIFLGMLCLMVLPTLVSGASVGGTIVNPIKSQTFNEFIDKILNVVIQIGYVVVVFFIVYTGFLFVTARGDEAQLKTAKNSLLWTVIGSAIVLGAQVLEKAIANTITEISK